MTTIRRKKVYLTPQDAERLSRPASLGRSSCAMTGSRSYRSEHVLAVFLVTGVGPKTSANQLKW